MEILNSCHYPATVGMKGSVIWSDLLHQHQNDAVIEKWLHIVELDKSVEGRKFVTCLEENLRPEQAYSNERCHVGTRNEISFDTESGHEGCLRRAGEFWQCFYISWKNVPIVQIESGVWKSGIYGHRIDIPVGTEISQAFAKDLIECELGTYPLEVISGPDSLVLK
ncbi:hypothetical protein [Hahella sp. CCB-MM4]|uniref:hypothetical protein n=1 Tax=Hahella sp. (strain CCB-MM4) TaxID=1926491 RepID=UPI00143D3D10|nr:hypothetical protein [Hahella sp. CCB-MM4]